MELTRHSKLQNEECFLNRPEYGRERPASQKLRDIQTETDTVFRHIKLAELLLGTISVSSML